MAVDNVKSKLPDFTGEQILMLQLSDKDIATDNIISQLQLDKNDFKWLNTYRRDI